MINTESKEELYIETKRVIINASVWFKSSEKHKKLIREQVGREPHDYFILIEEDE